MVDEAPDTAPEEVEAAATDANEAGAEGAAEGEALPPEPPPWQMPADPIGHVRSSWKLLWQLPVAVVASLMLVAGLFYAISTTPPPVYTPALDRAAELIDVEHYEDAIAELNQRVYPALSRNELPAPDARRYHLLLARAIYLGQRAMGIHDERNDLAVRDQYLAAERRFAVLTPRDNAFLADTYISLRMQEQALARAHQISETDRDLRDGVRRRVVESWLDLPVPKVNDALDLLGEMLSDPGLSVANRVWALDRQAGIQIELGYYDEAVTRLLRAIPRLDGVDPTELARLHLRLADAYRRVGALAEAGRHTDRAAELLPIEDFLRSRVLYLRGQIAEMRDQLDAARDSYAEVIDRYAQSREYGPAMLGLGEVEALLGATPSSIDTFSRLVRDVNRGVIKSDDASTEHITTTLVELASDQLAAGETEHALEYAGLADELYPVATAPPEVNEVLGRVHQSRGEQLLAEVSPDGAVSPFDSGSIDPSIQAEAQRHLLRAAAAYRAHAEQFVLSSIDRYADSLWAAGDLYDRAGDQPEAIAAFTLFAENLPSDPRQPEARYRLGRAYQAIGEYELAADRFRGLIADQRAGRSEVGPLAGRSLVPLAQSLIYDNDSDNDEQAEEILQTVVGGGVMGPDALQFREALIELGNLHYKRGEFARAVERFSEAVARGPTPAQAPRVEFLLADSNRQLADRIDDTLNREAMPDTRRLALETERDERRRRALDGFLKVRDELSSVDRRRLDPVQAIHLRNACFYLGDVAFDLGLIEEAIGYYDAARERYQQDPASLVALVQIVNAHIQQGDYDRARTANERAKRFFESLPDNVWDDPNLPMSRDDWERWLESSAKIYDLER